MRNSSADRHIQSEHKPRNGSGQRILYLGPDLSFSYAAAHAVFSGLDNNLIQCSSFADIFKRLQASCDQGIQAQGAVQVDVYDYAIVPVVNSTNGPVVPVVDLLKRCGDGRLMDEIAKHGVKSLDGVQLPISNSTSTEYPVELSTAAITTQPHHTAEASAYPDVMLQAPYTYDLAVHHYLYVHPACTIPAIDSPAATPTSALLSHSFTPITSLHTHPQVWTQCSRFLQTHFSSPNSSRTSSPTKHDHLSTSAAALYVSQHGGSDDDGTGVGYPAAICSRLAGEARGLKCVAEHIEDDTAGNTTTFVILGVRRGEGGAEGDGCS